MTPKKNEKKKQKKGVAHFCLRKRVASSGPLLSNRVVGVPSFFISHKRVVVVFVVVVVIYSNVSRKTVVNFRKRGEHPLARGEESRISGVDVCVARAVEQFRCAFFLRGRAQGKGERKKDAGIARCRRLIF